LEGIERMNIRTIGASVGAARVFREVVFGRTLAVAQRANATPERNDVHVDTIRSLVLLPGWQRDEAAKAQMLRLVDRALGHATEAGQVATIARLESLKGTHWEDEFLLTSAIAHAEASGDAQVRASTAYVYGLYLGRCARYATALDYIAHAIMDACCNRSPQLTHDLAVECPVISARVSHS
jgi:hypothetical protein